MRTPTHTVMRPKTCSFSRYLSHQGAENCGRVKKQSKSWGAVVLCMRKHMGMEHVHVAFAYGSTERRFNFQGARRRRAGRRRGIHDGRSGFEAPPDESSQLSW
eukprot:225422-Prymnesium_polylepis.1